MPDWIRQPAPYDHAKSLWENKQRDRGAVRCPGCKKSVDLDQQGDTVCECGQYFNAVGQALKPPSQWEERYEDDY